MKSLEKIVRTLIINGTLTYPPGLFFGKTGVAVFFFHYAKQTGNDLFLDYGSYLIEEIQKQIDDTFMARYDTGIAGIGTGFEYLLQNGLLVAEDSDVLDDFDDRMYRSVMYEPYPNLSLQEGLTGWGRYFIFRLRGNGKKNDKLHEALTRIAKEISQKIEEHTIRETDKPDVYRFLCDLTTLSEYAHRYNQSLQLCQKWECISDPDIQKIFSYMNSLQRLYTCQHYFNIDLTEEIATEWKKWEETDTNSLLDMGLLNGWTSNALLHLSFSKMIDTSWINLL